MAFYRDFVTREFNFILFFAFMSKKMFLHSRLGVDDAFSIFKLW
jgi:hypothetical protein